VIGVRLASAAALERLAVALRAQGGHRRRHQVHVASRRPALRFLELPWPAPRPEQGVAPTGRSVAWDHYSLARVAGGAIAAGRAAADWTALIELGLFPHAHA
jgi:hypothetical protein